ncbi:MAG: hypothetical protein JXR05_16290 [Flavobacteriaceae bacterium]
MKKLIFFLIGLTLFSCGEKSEPKDHANLASKLSGKWVAKAFDGELHEEWKLGKEGWMQQEGYYIEKKDTSYVAISQIQKVGEDIILFSVIRNSNPKIFKSTLFEDNKIVFVNKDYKNPFEVTYEFLSEQKYRRTIKGVKNDSTVIYKFDFEKRN